MWDKALAALSKSDPPLFGLVRNERFIGAKGTLWCSPYVVEIGEFVQEGENCLEVDVTSTWHNRLVYDASQEVEARKTWVIEGPKAGSSLKPYGLLGPVRLCYQK